MSIFNEEEAIKFLAKIRWPQGAECPYCKSKIINSCENHKTRSARYRCRNCKKSFSITASTCFAGLNISISKLLTIIFSNPKISSKELAKTIGVNPKTAWRIRNLIKFRLQKDCPFILKILGREVPTKLIFENILVDD